MSDIPFDIMSCSWPRPVQHADRKWTSEPEWDAALMPVLPQPSWTQLNGEECWRIDWRELFRGDLKFWGARPNGEMRGFHVVFRLRVNGTGPEWLPLSRHGWDESAEKGLKNVLPEVTT